MYDRVAISLGEPTLPHLALVHLDDGLHFLLPLDHRLHLVLDLLDVLGPALEVHHQLLAIHNLSLLFGVLDLQPQLLAVVLDPVDL